MKTQAVEIIETEVPLEETISLNHSRLINRFTLLLSAYEEQYDILPELEFELSAGRVKPDVAIMPRLTYNWEVDIIRFPNPPITAIEILSPTQSFDSLVMKIRQLYFPSGVQTAWLVVPAVRNIYLFLPDQASAVVSEGILCDPVSKVELEMSAIFR